MADEPDFDTLRKLAEENPQGYFAERTRLIEEISTPRIKKALSDKTLTEDSEARLIAAGLGMGLKKPDMIPVIDAELESTGSKRVLPPPPPPPPVSIGAWNEIIVP